LINAIPNNKSGSIDNLTFEHFEKHGDERLTSEVCVFLNTMIKHEFIPVNIKMGLTVTLHKGKGNTKSEPTNYRAILIRPVVHKLIETVVLRRLQSRHPPLELNKLQHGFQKGNSCTMV